MYHKKLKTPQLARSIFYCAIVTLLLGIGNIAFGNLKYSEYKEALVEAGQKVKNHSKPSPSKTIQNLNSSDFNSSLEQQLKRIKIRLSFYDFVILGGKVLLGISGILLLALLIILAPSGNTDTDNTDINNTDINNTDINNTDTE